MHQGNNSTLAASLLYHDTGIPLYQPQDISQTIETISAGQSRIMFLAALHNLMEYPHINNFQTFGSAMAKEESSKRLILPLKFTCFYIWR